MRRDGPDGRRRTSHGAARLPLRVGRGRTLALAAALLAGCSPAQHGVVTLRPDDAAVVATGARVYAAHCAACHGAKLEGQPNWQQRGADGRLPAPPHDATGHTWHHSDEQLFRLTKLGIGKVIGDPAYRTAMPAYEGVLSDAEIIAVLSYIKAQWPASVRERQDQLNRVAAGPR